MKINCPNCAAPIDPELNKCPYCGSTYFDMSCIDFENEKPFYLMAYHSVGKIKTKWNGIDCYITQFVKPKLTTIEFQGEQHTQPSNGFFSDELIKHDKMKEEYCKKNNIPLLCIYYQRGRDVIWEDLELE